MISQKLVVQIPTGLHLRPASVICNEAIKYKSLITISMQDKTVNAKSVLGVLSAGVKCGDEILLSCDGVDEKEAFDTLSKLILNNFGNECKN